MQQKLQFSLSKRHSRFFLQPIQMMLVIYNKKNSIVCLHIICVFIIFTVEIFKLHNRRRKLTFFFLKMTSQTYLRRVWKCR